MRSDGAQEVHKCFYKTLQLSTLNFSSHHAEAEELLLHCILGKLLLFGLVLVHKSCCHVVFLEVMTFDLLTAESEWF